MKTWSCARVGIAVFACTGLLVGCGGSEPAPGASGSPNAAVTDSAGESPSSADENATPEKPAQTVPTTSVSPADSGANLGLGTDPVVSEDYPAVPGEPGLRVAAATIAGSLDAAAVTFSFTGEGVPGYSVEYVDQAVADASGEVIDMPGEALLRVSLSGILIPEDPGQVAFGITPVADESSVVDAIYLGPPFEGISTSYIGLDEQRPFEVLVLRSMPPRVQVRFLAE